MSAISKCLTRINRDNLLIIILVSALLISAFILPTTLMDVFSSGPSLWFRLVLASFLIQLTISYFLNPAKEVLISFNIVDIIALTSLVFVILQGSILSVPYSKPITYCLLIITYYIVKFSLSRISASEKNSFYFAIISVTSFVALISCIIGISQIINILPSNNQYFRVTGNFKNPARFATYLSSLFPTSFCFYVFYRTNQYPISNIKTIAGISLLTVLFVLPATYSRSSWLGLAVVILLVIYLKYKIKFIRKLKKISPVLLTSCVVFTILFVCLLYFIKPQSANGRLNVWSMSFPMFLRHPLFGIGYGQFEYQYDKYQAMYFSSHNHNESKILSSDIIRYPYNIFLQVLYEQGLLGLTIFVSIIVKSIPYHLFKPSYIITNKDVATISSFMGIVAILVGGLTSYPFDILPVQIIFYIYLAILSSSNYCRSWPRFFIRKNIKLYFNLAIFLGGFVLILNVFHEYQGYRLWKIAEENPTKVQNLEPIYSVLNGNPDFLEFYTARLLTNKEYEKVISTCGQMDNILMYPSFYIYLAQSYSAQGSYYKAEKNYLFASNMIPNRFYLQYLLDKFYYDHHNYIASILVSKRILNMKIKIPSKTVDKVIEQAKIILTESSRQLQLTQ